MSECRRGTVRGKWVSTYRLCILRVARIFDFRFSDFQIFRFSIFDFLRQLLSHPRTAHSPTPQPTASHARKSAFQEFQNFGISEFRLLHSHSHSHSHSNQSTHIHPSTLPNPRSHHPPNAEVYSNILNKSLPPQSEEYARPSTLPHARYLPMLTLLYTRTTELSDFPTSDFPAF